MLVSAPFCAVATVHAPSTIRPQLLRELLNAAACSLFQRTVECYAFVEKGAHALLLVVYGAF